MVKASMTSPAPEKPAFPGSTPAATILGGQSPPTARASAYAEPLHPLTREAALRQWKATGKADGKPPFSGFIWGSPPW